MTNNEQPVSEQQIEEWRRFAGANPCKPPYVVHDGAYAAGYWLGAHEVEEGHRMLRSLLAERDKALGELAAARAERDEVRLRIASVEAHRDALFAKTGNQLTHIKGLEAALARTKDDLLACVTAGKQPWPATGLNPPACASCNTPIDCASMRAAMQLAKETCPKQLCFGEKQPEQPAQPAREAGRDDVLRRVADATRLTSLTIYEEAVRELCRRAVGS